MNHWDRRFLEFARNAAAWSKDPSTQAGAVIADENRRIVSVGFNGFPRGVLDFPERYANRETKYKMIVHADINAIVFAERNLAQCTMYTWPLPPCARCAAVIAQTEICRVVSPPLPERLVERWGEDMEFTQLMFREAGVHLDIAEGFE